MKKLFLILTLVLISEFLLAQKNLKPSYIITNQNDTIWGTGIINKNQEYCFFQPHNKAKYNKYYPENLNEFRILKGRYYITKQIEDKWFFLEYLIDGELDLYVLRKNGQDRFFIEKDSVSIRELLYNKDKIINVDGDEYYKEDKSYLGLIKIYMKDSPEMYRKIENMQVIKQKSLIKLAEDYHNSVCFDGECINYSKTIPKVSLKLEPITGVNYHNNFYTPLCGVFLNVWLPRKNERLYFKVGLQYSTLPYSTRLDSEYSKNGYKVRIPFYWQYVFGNKKVKPTFGIGFVNGRLQTSVQSGIIYSVSNNFELTINGSVDGVVALTMGSNKDIYNNSFAHSLMIGCQFKVR